MVAQERVGFRPPLTTILPVAVVLVLLGLIFPSDGIWGFVVVFSTVFGVLRMRQLTVLTDEHVEVTMVRTRRIPWADIDMDFMNLNQAAHGDREYAHMVTRMGI